MNNRLSKALKHWETMRERDEGCGLATSSLIIDYYTSALSGHKADKCSHQTRHYGYGSDSCGRCIFSAIPDDNFIMNQLVEEIVNESS